MFRRPLALSDAIAAAFVVLISGLTSGTETSIAMLCGIPLLVFVSGLFGTYERHSLFTRKSTLEEVPRLFQLATVYAMIVWVLNGFLVRHQLSHWSLVLFWAEVLVLLVACRAVTRAIARRNSTPERCVVLGHDNTCDWVRARLGWQTGCNAQVVAGVPLQLHQNDSKRLTTEDVDALIRSVSADRLIVQAELVDEQELADLLQSAASQAVKVSIVPRFLEVVGTSADIEDVGGLPLISVRDSAIRGAAAFWKRSFDLAGSLVLIILTAPILAAVAAAIRLDTRGPVFFRQRRVGRHDAAFEMLKFRTMVSDADEQKQHLAHLNEAIGLFKIEDDPRITRVGRFLRRTSFDELPQLFNVLRGEMSLVGPRPLVAEEDSCISGWQRGRLRLTPGMTGQWQILGSARIPLSEMARIDYAYVTGWSLWLDLKILLRTVPYMLARRGM